MFWIKEVDGKTTLAELNVEGCSFVEITEGENFWDQCFIAGCDPKEYMIRQGFHEITLNEAKELAQKAYVMLCWDYN